MRTLTELVHFIREAVPSPDAILHLNCNEEAAGVSFSWKGTEFFVTSSLRVVEIRHKKLFLTGHSILLQALLAAKERQWNLLNPVADQLGKIEHEMKDPRSWHRGMELLRSTRDTLGQLVPAPKRSFSPSIHAQRSPNLPISKTETAEET